MKMLRAMTTTLLRGREDTRRYFKDHVRISQANNDRKSRHQTTHKTFNKMEDNSVSTSNEEA